ncbi:AT-hook motif nuclear-localized protein 13-like [Impatiens glandulifera]|uniref:AT-hook motif nuclear-localized protein 13-like n=1 Tax=Impatiens glandulifera TaxID=253017 RepID=UPI001FB0ED69|nr:AT-hook motif nuclear-localized protein 13-like [Impatiens glandulifera]
MDSMGSHLRTSSVPQPHVHPQQMMMMGQPPSNMYQHPIFNPNSSPAMMNPNPSSVVAMLQNSYFSLRPHDQPPPPMPVQRFNQQFGGGGGGGPTMQNNNESLGIDVEPVKKKRGRPRKYPLDNNNNNLGMGLLSDSGANTPSFSPVFPMNQVGASSSSNPLAKKGRGRPLGSGKKQIDKLGSPVSASFTPHMIWLEKGEDIVAKLYEFSQDIPRTVFVFSISGAVCDATLVYPPQSGITVTHKGPLQILSLTATFSPPETNDSNNQTDFTISLSGAESGVVGGEVYGKLIAATKIQIVLASFIEEAKKSKYEISPIQSNEGAVPVAGESPASDCPSSAASQEHVDNFHNVNNTLSHFDNINTPVYNMGHYSNAKW